MKINIKCIKGVANCFTEGRVYSAKWFLGVPMSLKVEEDDEGRKNHVVAEYDLQDEWFKKHFEVVAK